MGVERDTTQLGQLIPADPRGIPYHMASHPAYKAGGRREKGRMFEIMMSVFIKWCGLEGTLKTI